MSDFLNYLWNLFVDILTYCWEFLCELVWVIFDSIVGFVMSLLSIPFECPPVLVSVLHNVNWFYPMEETFVLLGGFIVFISVYWSTKLIYKTIVGLL